MKILLAILLTFMLAGCEERYRYPCQNPKNWDKDWCKKPFCSGNGTCPEDLSHYLKEKQKNPTQITKDERGACK